jgi:CDP-diacylglycerol--glycerol-3-phosphate 3-phosphatidyltransferase
LSTSDPRQDPTTGSPDDGDDDEAPAMWSRERVVTGWAQLWNIPNMLTLLRILLIPVFWWVLMYDDGQDTAARLAATAIFIVASFTDWLDGYLARKEGLVTTFGKIADPLADKALTGVALIGLSVLGELYWWVTILIIGREVGVTLVRFVVLKHGVIPASRGGKLKTMFQMAGIVLFLLPLPSDVTILWLSRNAVMAVAVALTVVTGLDYIGRAYRTRSDSKADKARRAERRAARARGEVGTAGSGSAGSGSGSAGSAGSAGTAPGAPTGPAGPSDSAGPGPSRASGAGGSGAPPGPTGPGA